MFRKKIVLLIVLTLWMATAAQAEIKSQWRGSNRDGVYQANNIQKSWLTAGPTEIWSVSNIGKGFSSPAVTADRVYATGLIDGKGYLFAFDKTGKQIYKKSYGDEWAKSYPGARTTPTVVDDRIYVVSGVGVVVCLNASNGSIVWSVDMKREFGCRVLKWGFSESALIDGDKVICTPGGPEVTMAALDRHTGKTIWTCTGDGDLSAYCSPVLVQHGNRRLILTMTQRAAIGVDADTGEFLWSHKHVTEYDIHPNTPIYKDGMVYVVSGYGTGGQMLKLNVEGSKVTKIWSDEELDSQHGAAVLVNGYIYGSGHKNRGWKCLDWETGKLAYSSREFGKGNIIYADDMLICYTEAGELGLVEPNPKAFTFAGSIKIEKGSDQHWAHPVVDEGRLYLRHGDALMVFDVKQ